MQNLARGELNRLFAEPVLSEADDALRAFEKSI